MPTRRKSIDSRHSAPARYHDYDEEEGEERPRRFRDIEDIMDLRTGGASDSVSDGSLSSNGASVRSTSSASAGLTGPAFRGFFPIKGSGFASDGSLSGEDVRSAPPESGGVAGLDFRRFFPGESFRFGRSKDSRSVSSTDLSSMMAEGESTTINTGDRSGSLRLSLSSRDSILSYGGSGGPLSLSESSSDSSSSSSSIRSFDLSAMMGGKSARIGKGNRRCCRSSTSARQCARLAVVVTAAAALAMLAYQARHGISKSMLDGIRPATSNFKMKTDGSNSFRKLFDSQHRGSSDNGSFSQVQDAARDYQQVQDAAPVYQLQYQPLPDGGGRLVLGNMSGAVANDEAAPAGRAIPAYKEFKPNDKVNLDSEIVALMERSVYDHNDKWKK